MGKGVPEKRPDSGYDNLPEQPPEKRLKNDDLPTKEDVNCATAVQSVKNSEKEDSFGSSKSSKGRKLGKGNTFNWTCLPPEGNIYCLICGYHTDHSYQDCFNQSGMGSGCVKCRGPCQIKGHEDSRGLILRFCVYCGASGKHWSTDCPTPLIFDDEDLGEGDLF